MPTIRRYAEPRDDDNDIHYITMLMSNISFSHSDTSYEEPEGAVER